MALKVILKLMQYLTCSDLFSNSSSTARVTGWRGYLLLGEGSVHPSESIILGLSQN